MVEQISPLSTFLRFKKKVRKGQGCVDVVVLSAVVMDTAT